MDSIIFLGYEILVALLPCLAVLWIFRKKQMQKGVIYARYHVLAVIIFAVYVVGVYHFTGAGTIYDGFRYQLEWRKEQLNFVPFANEIDIVAYFLNVLLFIPLGLLAPVIWQKMNKLINVIGIGFFFTLLIEISQLLNNRRTDVDDILMNAFGAVVGFVLFRIWDKFTKSKYQISSPIVVELFICFLVVFIGRFFLFYEMGLAKVLYGF